MPRAVRSTRPARLQASASRGLRGRGGGYQQIVESHPFREAAGVADFDALGMPLEMDGADPLIVPMNERIGHGFAERPLRIVGHAHPSRPTISSCSRFRARMRLSTSSITRSSGQRKKSFTSMSSPRRT